MNDAIDHGAEILKEIAPEVIERNLAQCALGVNISAAIMAICLVGLVVCIFLTVKKDYEAPFYLAIAFGVTFFFVTIVFISSISSFTEWQHSPVEALLKYKLKIS